NPSGQSNPVTIHARRTKAILSPENTPDMFADDVKTLYDLDAPESGRLRLERTYSEGAKGETATLRIGSWPLQDLKVIDLDTAETLPITKQTPSTIVKLAVPIADAKQSAHLKVTGTLADGSYKLMGDMLVFDRTVNGLRNTILLPAGWDVTG